MTPLNKDVTRKSTVLYHGKEVVVTMRADQQIEFRLLGCGGAVKAPIMDLYRYVERTDTDVHIPQRKR